MTIAELRQYLGLTQEEWGALSSCDGFYRICDNLLLLKAIVKYCRLSTTKNPFAKFFAILNKIEQKNYVTFSDLYKLDEQFKMHTIATILLGQAESYTGCHPANVEILRKQIGKRNKTFNYDNFCNLIVSML